MIQINKNQLFNLMMLFGIGSTTLFVLGIKAKADAWLVEIISVINALVLLWIYIRLQLAFPDKNLAEIITTLLGKAVGYPLAFLYGFYFMESSVLNISEFGFLIHMTILDKTPLLVINVVFILVIAYALFCGLEVISRTSQIVFPVILLFILTTFFMTLITGLVNLGNLAPVLENGIMPVLRAVYPTGIIVPFSESIIFLMYWRYTDSIKGIQKISFMALGIFGVIITCSTVLIISVLGVNYAEVSSVPLMDVIRAIKINKILTRMDVLGVVTIFIGGFYKALINLFGSLLVFASLFKIKNNLLIIPVCLLSLLITQTSIPSLMFHRFIGWNVFAGGIHVFFQIFIPVQIYIIYLLKNSAQNQKRKN